jgi:aspartate racemase
MARAQKVVGVLGGMGPEATVDFMAKVIAATPANADQDHVHMLVDHNPTVPNRQDAILGDGTDPGPALADMAARLEAAGADFLVIPCNTAYVFQDSIIAATRLPLVSIIEVTVAEVISRVPGARKVGVLATDGCLSAGVYQDALAARAIEPLVPEDAGLLRLMDLVNGIKAGRSGAGTASGMRDLATGLCGQGAQALIAGCTEIPLVLEQSVLPVPLISSTDALAMHTVALARGELPLPVKES